jgi:hypothetical protein
MDIINVITLIMFEKIKKAVIENNSTLPLVQIIYLNIIPFSSLDHP